MLTEEICGVCSKKVETRLGQATFTAECSCSFHLNCLTGRLSSGNQLCPTCNSLWKAIPPIYTNYSRPSSWSHVPAPSTMWPEPPCGHLFSDDEPLPAAVPIGDSTPSIKPLPSLTLKAFPELPALAASDSISKFAALVGVQAPPLVDDSKRAPIDLVAVLDVSGSMTGSKIALLKRAVEFVIQNLGPSDRLSIVAFSTGAQRIFPLRRMNDRGRDDAIIAVKSLSASGSTNIVEGLKKGVRVLKECLVQNPVGSIMFLSDGMDTYNHNHLNIKKYLPLSICPKPGNGEAAAAPIVVHSFGFGSDHDAANLHAISAASGGTFSFVESIEIVQDAFAKCIGGLLSVVLQQVRLTMRTLSPGVHIQSIPSGKYFSSAYCQGREGVIDIGDLYADEEKDFLVYLAVPPTSDSEAVEETNTLLMDVMCSFRDSISDQMMQVHGERVEIRRPEILSPDDTIVRLEVDRQRNRLSVAEGIAEAQTMADRGDLAGAQAVLTNRKSTLLSSASAQAGDELCNWLESELVEIRERMASMELYEQAGRAYAYAGMSSHARQRGTTLGVVRDCLKERTGSRLVQACLKKSTPSRSRPCKAGSRPCKTGRLVSLECPKDDDEEEDSEDDDEEDEGDQMLEEDDIELHACKDRGGSSGGSKKSSGRRASIGKGGAGMKSYDTPAMARMVSKSKSSALQILQLLILLLGMFNHVKQS